MKKVMILILLMGVSYGDQMQKLRYVIDGDTVQFQDVRCRLAWIDTPESKPNKKAKKDSQTSRIEGVTVSEIVKAGRISSSYLKSIMQKGHSYRFSVISKETFRKKGSNRSICVIFDDDGYSINHRIIENGFAVPFWRYIKSSVVREEMDNATKQAIQDKKGLWRIYPNVLGGML